MIGNVLSAILLTLIGAALLLNGYRWFRLLLPIWAFLVGYGVVAGLMSALFGQGFFGTALTIIPGIVLGLIFAVFSYLWYGLAVLFWAGTVGYVLFAGLIAMPALAGLLIVIGVRTLKLGQVATVWSPAPRTHTAHAGTSAFDHGATGQWTL